MASQGGYHTNLALAYLMGGAPKASTQHGKKALAIVHQFKDLAGERTVLNTLIRSCADAEDPEGVMEFASAALELSRQDEDSR